MKFLNGLYETRWFWWNKRYSIDYNSNSLAWKIANEQYRAAMGW